MRTMRSLALLGAVSLIFVTANLGCGRTPSRVVGKAGRQVLQIPDMKAFISISYDKRGDATVKDVTYRSTDGYIYTQEFKDLSPLEGTIRWVPHNEGSSFFQGRGLSRWFGVATNLSLPEDCDEVLGVDITYESAEERRKNLTYRSKEGAIYSREYREGMVDRHFVGWLEISGGE